MNGNPAYWALDIRPLGIAIVTTDKKYYNWTTKVFEAATFAAASHIKAMTAIGAAADTLLKGYQFVDCPGDALLAAVNPCVLVYDFTTPATPVQIDLVGGMWLASGSLPTRGSFGLRTR